MSWVRTRSSGKVDTRADNCGREYRQLAFAFSKTMLPVIDPAARKKAQFVQWLPSDELR
jgi:hypothetical protein